MDNLIYEIYNEIQHVELMLQETDSDNNIIYLRGIIKGLEDTISIIEKSQARPTLGTLWLLTHIVKSMMRLNLKTMIFIPMAYGFVLSVAEKAWKSK